eukprot:scaffold26206_cov17-Tisochrysis_lutea.AAC.1
MTGAKNRGAQSHISGMLTQIWLVLGHQSEATQSTIREQHACDIEEACIANRGVNWQTDFVNQPAQALGSEEGSEGVIQA